MEQIQYTLEEMCLEITNQCLLNCVHCSSDSSSSGKHMDKRTVFKVIEDFEEMGGRQLELSGGEPLLHPDISEILNYSIKKSLITKLYSTGMTPSNSFTYLRKNRIDKVVISLNGMKRVTNEITGRDSYTQTRNFIEELVGIGMDTEIHFTPMKQNIKDFDKLVEECNDIGVDKIKILKLIPQGRALRNWEKIHVPETEFKKFIEYACNINSDVKIEIGTPASAYFCLEGDCKAATSTCLISSDGFIYPCPALKTDRYLSAGNLHEKSLIELWQKGFSSIRYFKEKTRPYCLAPWVLTNYQALHERKNI